MKLIIAEKPSVAEAIAHVLGVHHKKDGYLVGENHLISWCFGHLVALAAPDSYNEAYSKWNYKDLPILPKTWSYTVSPETKKQYEVLKKLLHDSRVDTVICATDAGREGELIFRLVYEKCGCTKPVKRLWISSMEDSAIKQGLDQAIDNTKYDTLYQAALCRAKADWLVGMNGTRLFSVLHGKTLNVGRVMTPTLAMITDRETAISAFQKEKFYTVGLTFDGFSAESDRYSDKQQANQVRAACLGKTATVREYIRKEKKEYPPQLFDLTSLQREANRLHGYTAQQTLDYAQALYEKKLITYPRTDSRYLTADMENKIPDLCEILKEILPFAVDTGDFHTKQIVNDAKVTDHHALIPTKAVRQSDISILPAGERNILFLIAARLFCALGKVCNKEEVSVMIRCMEVDFSAKGTVTLQAGWKDIEQAFFSALRDRPKKEKETTLPVLEEGRMLTAQDIEVKEGATSPPKPFTEDTLLAAMEHAGSEEFTLIPEAEHRGLGTPATRAGIIEKLVKTGFVVRKKKQLIPTQKAEELVSILPETVKSAKLTADWEAALKKVERGELSPEDFLNGIAQMVSEMVASNKETARNYHFNAAPIGKCPRCGGNVGELTKGFVCENRECGFALWKQHPLFVRTKKELTESIAKEILTYGQVKIGGLYSEKKDKYYTALVIMEDTGKFINYRLQFDSGERSMNKNGQ